MFLARVDGVIVATVGHPSMAGHRSIICQPLDEQGRDEGAPVLAVDPLGCLVELNETCSAALPASTGAWDVFVGLDQDPCDLRPAIGPEPDALNEPGTLRDVVRL